MKIKYLILTIIWTLFIFVNSLLPANISSEESGFFVKIFLNMFPWLNQDIISIVIRKAAHFFVFSILGFLVYQMLNNRKYLGLIIGLLVAITDELIQNFSQGRSSSIFDVMIDYSGFILIYLIMLIIKKDNLK